MQLVAFNFLDVDKSDKDYSMYQNLFNLWYPEIERSKTSWGKIKQSISTKQIDSTFQEIKLKYKPSAKSQSYSMANVNEEINKNFKPKRSFIIGGDYVSRGYFGIFSEKPIKINIKYQLIVTGSAPKVTISGIDSKFTSTLAYVLNKKNGELKFTIPAGETTLFINAVPGTIYRMEVNVDNGFLFFDGSPRGIMAFYQKFDDPINSYTYNPEYYPSYIFFPKNISTLDYKVQLNALQITNPSDKKISSKLMQTQDGGFEIRQFSVKPEETGKLWKTVITGNYGYNFLNIPDRYYLLEKK
jgi:hypothetical protein